VVDAPANEIAGVNIAHIDPKKLTPALIRRLRESSAIRIVEPVPARWLAKKKPRSDPKANRQWGLNAIEWYAAKRTSAAKLVCGVIDSGIDRGHPDLAGVVTAYDHAGSSASDVIGHGTHVAGIIAALANNDVGITGVVDCKLSIWKVFGDDPDPNDGEYYVDMDRYLKALRAMEEARVSVLNLSLGGTESSQVEALLMKRLAKAGVSVFAAMGNEYDEGNPTEYPAAYESVWAVGAVDAASKRARFSNTGKHVHIAAPGVGILPTVPRTRSKARDETNYASWDGTSMATPYVSGAAMLLCAQGVHSTPKSIARRLASTATRLKGMGSKSHSTSFGAGLLNLEKALR
jgi:subtilisin family serine protease